MNDPPTLGFYTEMKLFQANPANFNKALQFPATLDLSQTRIVYVLANNLNLDIKLDLDGFITVTHRTT
jgi:hypothetical protein